MKWIPQLSRKVSLYLRRTPKRLLSSTLPSPLEQPINSRNKQALRRSKLWWPSMEQVSIKNQVQPLSIYSSKNTCSISYSIQAKSLSKNLAVSSRAFKRVKRQLYWKEKSRFYRSMTTARLAASPSNTPWSRFINRKSNGKYKGVN